MNSVFCILKLGVIQNYIHAARGYIYLFWFVSVYVCVCVCVSVFVCVCACVSCLLSLCVIESKVKRTWGRQGEWRAEGGGVTTEPKATATQADAILKWTEQCQIGRAHV